MQLVCIKELNIHYTLVYAFTCCITVSVCSVVAPVAASAAAAAASECSRLAVFQSAVFVFVHVCRLKNSAPLSMVRSG